MPAKVIQKQHTPLGNNMSESSFLQQRVAQSPRTEDSNSAADGHSRRRLRKASADGPASSTQVGNTSPSEAESRLQSSRRRPSIRTKGPQGARPMAAAQAKNMTPSSLPGANKPTLPNSRPTPRSRQPSVGSASQFNFGTKLGDNAYGREGAKTQETTQFLPPVNFDDLHASLTFGDLGDLDFTTTSSFDQPAGKEPPKNSSVSIGEDIRRKNGLEQPVGSAGGLGRPNRSNSFVRPPSPTVRQKIQGPVKPMAAGEPPSLPRPSNSRRQSHFAPSTVNNAAGRAPRKSVGPGILSNSTSEYSFFNDGGTGPARARQEAGSQIGTQERLAGQPTPRYSLASTKDLNILAKGRSAKAKSMQPPPRKTSDYLQPSSMTPDIPSGNPLTTSRSPGRDNINGPATPSSGKRMSMMPGHATGLGARTVSPTDARRMKRLSMMPNPPPVPNTPPDSMPEPPFHQPHEQLESPSMIPRKSATPSSNRTTPEHNRKSYSSGISISSNTSLNSARNSTNMTRLQQSATNSRLPTLKGRAESAANNAVEEGVPPVPAIPKAYESPKNETDSPLFFAPRKSSLALDNLSVNSSSTLEYVSAPSTNSSDKEIPKPERELKKPKGTTSTETGTDEERASGAQNGRRTMQPIRLPPLNLLTLNTPTSNKIAVLQDKNAETPPNSTTPPPRHGPPKTPSTPLTASKASFFSRNHGKEDNVFAKNQPRSSSSHYTSRYEQSSNFHAPNSPVSGAIDIRAPRKVVSPFISSSLPKVGGDFTALRQKQGSDRSASRVSTETKPSRLNGPRAQTSVKSIKSDASNNQNSPSDTEGASFGHSLRRKLSLTRKRSVSKVDGEQPSQPPNHDSMPPPKLPASATNGSWLSTPSPTKKGTYLQSNRRKSSHPESLIRQERTRSEVFVPDGSAEKDSRQSNDTKPRVVTKTSSQTGIRQFESNSSLASSRLHIIDTKMDASDLIAEEEMARLALKRKKTEIEARELDELRRRAVARERVSPAAALRAARLNIYERGEIVDFKDIYFCGTQDAKKFAGNLEAESANFGYDDDRGDYNIVIGDHLSYRYEVVDLLGKGSFGQVVRCVDHKTGGLVAIKIIRNKKRFHQQALVEVNILQKLREWDPENKYSMVSFTQSFYFRGHLCISTELLGMNLYEFIKVHDFRGFSLKLIRRFTKQMLNSLVLLKSHKVIHCDLKPENILLAHPAHSEIKVIDFGSSCLENEKVYTYIQSRFYRSPEVILGMSYGMPIDMWSLGCILAELLTGYPIFPGENEQEQLACIMEVFGPPDKHLIEKSTRKKLFFDSVGKPRLTVSSKGKRRRPSSKTLQQVLKCDDHAFLDFLAKCLRWDPERRLKPDEAMHHEFITGIKPVTVPRNQRSSQSVPMHAKPTSPIKRFSSLHQPSSSVRPLPNPPATVLKSGFGPRAGEGPNGGSPSKVTPKGHSTVSGLTNGFSNNLKGPGPAPTTALPKLSTPRITSGRQEMAAAAAAAATTSQKPR